MKLEKRSSIWYFSFDLGMKLEKKSRIWYFSSDLGMKLEKKSSIWYFSFDLGMKLLVMWSDFAFENLISFEFRIILSLSEV
jgi:hypothetical protein